VVPVAMNILYNAAVLLRAQSLRYQGVPLPANFPQLMPLELDELERRVSGEAPDKSVWPTPQPSLLTE